MTLQPDNLILTGAPEKLPHPPGAPKGPRNGQVVECWVENIGKLVNVIGDQTQTQPHAPQA